MPKKGTESSPPSGAPNGVAEVDARAALELADLADELIAELARMRRGYAELAEILASLSAAEAEAGSTHRRGADGDSRAQLDAAKNIARKAALAGASPETVEAYLREELGLSDGAATVAEVFREIPPLKKRRR